MHYTPIIPPLPRTLLPPLLACLPTSFASPSPPPALLPLLSPTLRQRIQYLASPVASTSAPTTTDSWLPLLSRHPASAQELVDVVSESDAFELHPVSGEIDVGEVEPLLYRRLDEETLQCRVGVPGLRLVVIYLWCTGDSEGGSDGWRVCEVQPYSDDQEMEGSAWFPTMDGADDALRNDIPRHGGDLSLPVNGSGAHNGGPVPTINGAITADAVNDDDDDYWARYDNTPGRTPAMTPGVKTSPLPDQAGRARSTSEDDYYAQYAQVQPEMDGNDPSEDRKALGDSTLNGNGLVSAMGNHQRGGTEPDINENHNQSVNDPPHHGTVNGLNINSLNGEVLNGINHPAVTASTPSIERLQDSAEMQSIAEIAIKQHVGASMKSLFRLCRSTGMDRGEFDEMIREELETLKIIDDE